MGAVRDRFTLAARSPQAALCQGPRHWSARALAQDRLPRHARTPTLRLAQHIPRHRVPPTLQMMRRTKPSNSRCWALPKPHQHMKMLARHRRRDHLRAVVQQRLDQRIAHNHPQRPVQHHRLALHQPLRRPPLLLMRLARREIAVITLTMLPMMPRPPAAFIASDPCAVGVARAVVPVVPRPVPHTRNIPEPKTPSSPEYAFFFRGQSPGTPIPGLSRPICPPAFMRKKARAEGKSASSLRKTASSCRKKHSSIRNATSSEEMPLGRCQVNPRDSRASGASRPEMRCTVAVRPRQAQARSESWMRLAVEAPLRGFRLSARITPPTSLVVRYFFVPPSKQEYITKRHVLVPSCFEIAFQKAKFIFDVGSKELEFHAVSAEPSP